MITPYIYRLCYLYSNNFPKYNSTKNYYSILNISQNSKKDTIRNAFLNLAKKYHPDLNPNEAYQVLSNTQQKKIYDQFYNQYILGRAVNNQFGNKSGYGEQQRRWQKYGYNKQYNNYKYQYNSYHGMDRQNMGKSRKYSYHQCYQQYQQDEKQRQPFTFEQNEQQMKSKYQSDKKMREQWKKQYYSMMSNYQFTTASNNPKNNDKYPQNKNAKNNNPNNDSDIIIRLIVYIKKFLYELKK